MQEDKDGFPKLGDTATTLGVRFGRDILVDSAGCVHRPAFVPGEPNGLSCAPLIPSLPPFVLPLAWGGVNKKTGVWSIEDTDLGVDLIAQEDSGTGVRRHLSIGPSRTMAAVDFEAAIQATRLKWRKV